MVAPEPEQLEESLDLEVDLGGDRWVLDGVEPDGEHARGASAGDVGGEVVADHGRLVGTAAQSFEGELEEGGVRLADGDRPDAGGHGDRLGQGAAAGVEGV